MTTNPLKSDAPRPGKVNADTLYALAQSLNQEAWVQRIGRSYGVSVDAHGRHSLSWKNILPSASG